MSGGAYDYAYAKIEQMAEELRDTGREHCATPAMRRAFKAHLFLVAKACMAIEWNDSADGDEREVELLREILGPHAELEQLVKEAKQYVRSLTMLIDEAQRETK